MIRKLIGDIGRLLLTKEDKKALRTAYFFRKHVTEAEVWLCGFPQMRYALQYIRVRALGINSAGHKCLQTDKEAHVDISTFREKMRALYVDESQHLPSDEQKKFQSACVMDQVQDTGEQLPPVWYTCHVCKRSQSVRGSKKCCGYYLIERMEEEPVLNFDKECGIH